MMRILAPEQLVLDLPTAGYGSRGLAYLCDFIIRWTTVALFFLFGLMAMAYLVWNTPEVISTYDRFISIFSSSKDGSVKTLAYALGVLAIFFVEYSYPIYFEVRHQGVTPGKRMFGLRVVGVNGLPIDFQTSLLRTIMLVVDLIPGFGFVGMISMVLTNRSQRLGDILANTTVIHDFSTEKIAHSRLQHDPSTGDYLSLPVDVYTWLEDYALRCRSLNPVSRRKLLDQVRPVLSKYIEIDTLLADSSASERELVEAVLKRAVPLRKDFENEASTTKV